MTVNIRDLKSEETDMMQFTEKDAIYNLQTYLRAQSFIYDDAPDVPVDGIFDSATKNALIDFQLRNGLPPTGIADKTTWELLYAQYLEILDTVSLPYPIIPFPSYPRNYTVKLNDKSFTVATIQYMLNEIGIIYDMLPSVEINGIYDDATSSIIKKFQEINSLPQTGEVDRATWARLSRIYNLTLHYIEQY